MMRPGPITPPPITINDRVRSAVCFLFSPLLGAAAKARGTVGVGVGGNAGVGFIAGIAASAGIQIVADRERNVGIAISVGGNPGYGVLGVGALGGVQGSVSTGSNIYALSSWSIGGGMSGGAGMVVSGDVAFSNTASTLTGTFGVGTPTGKAAAFSLNYTWVPSMLSTNCKN
jgi:hypothetical protein